MKDAQEFKVHLMGISEKDKQMLQRVLRISMGATRTYVLTENSDPLPNTIFMVNSDSNEDIERWSRRYLGKDNKPSMPTVFAGHRIVKGDHVYNVGLPFRATQILSVLDKVTVTEMNFIPELTIGKSSRETGISHKILEEIASSRGGKHQFTAMVVDDSQPVRKQLEIELKMLGANVEVAENGEQALQLTKDKDFDIIFLDVVMPGMDGYKVCKVLKKDQRSKNTPVIMLTGKSSPFDKVKGTLSGCDTYLTKPLEHEEFQSITKKYIPQVNA